MNFISYAQNFEDVILWRALKHIDRGFYIDVGAYDPDDCSVTKAFYEHGWRGINIEPVTHCFENLERGRERDINLQVAAGAEHGEKILYEVTPGLSTFDRETAERHKRELGHEYRAYNVPVMTLTDICQQWHVAPVHFLKIDVECAENEVLQGLDLSRIRPWIMVIEATLPNTQVPNHEHWEPYLLNSDYEFVYFDGLNRFYLARERSELKDAFAVPPNVFDGFVKYSEHNALVTARKLAAQLEAERQKTERINQLDRELRAVYASRSWRITWPLRRMSLVVRSLVTSPTQVAHGMIRTFKTPVRPLLLQAMRFVLDRPGMRQRLNDWLRRYPRLHERLKSIARHGGLLPPSPETPHWQSMATGQPDTQGTNNNLNAMPAETRRVYRELQQARRRRSGGNP